MEANDVSRVRRTLCATVLAAAVLAPSARAATAGDAIAGVWLTEERDSKVSIAVHGEGAGATLDGKIVWLAQPTSGGKPALDVQNADPALRARPIMGLAILSGFEPAAGGGWTAGSIYAPRSGKSYPAELAVGTDGRLRIRVKAGIVTKTIEWTR